MTLAPIDIDETTFLRDHSVLPPLPGTVTRVLEAVNSATMGAGEVARLISPDAAMVTHLLKVVNSAYYGLPKPIADVKYAIAYLGLSEVSRIALALSVLRALKPKEEDELERFWMHSYLTAIVARHVVKKLRNVYEIDNLYSAALLHDMGKLIYQKFFPDHYAELRRFCTENGRMFVDAEAHYGMPSHNTFGALACDHWNLPRAIKRACEFHELANMKSMPSRSDADPIDVAITVANMLASVTTESLDPELTKEIELEVQRVLECSGEDYVLLMADICELRTQASELLAEISGI